MEQVSERGETNVGCRGAVLPLPDPAPPPNQQYMPGPNFEIVSPRANVGKNFAYIPSHLYHILFEVDGDGTWLKVLSGGGGVFFSPT